MILKNAIHKISEEEKIYKLNENIIQDRGSLIEIHLADIHFGAMDPKYQYEILCEQCLDKVKNINFDIFCINGDLFHYKAPTVSSCIIYATMLVGKIVDLCREKNATFIIIEGTKSHDSDQLKLFYHYLNDKSVDVRIVQDIKFEYVKGTKILCIPEKYSKGEEYYNIMKTQWYDTVFMHGVVEGAIYQAKNQESGFNSDKAPTFTLDDFSNCRGPIISGHVHTPGCFNGYFYYCGSPYNWQFGEPNSKGFLMVLHNLNTHEHYVHLETIQSFKYETINLDHLLKSDPKDIIEYVNTVQSKGIDFVRIEFNEVNTTPNANLDIVKQFYSNNAKVKLKINKSDTIEQLSLENAEDNSKYDYMYDKELSPYDILSKYIEEKEGCVYVTAEEIKQFVENDF